MIPKLLRKILSYTINNIKGSKKIFNRNDLYKSLGDIKDKKIVYKNDEIFQDIGNKFKEIDFAISKDINSVCGWVPFVSAHTKVLLYNFFSVNYSIRKQLIARISLVNGLNVLEQKLFLVPSNFIGEIDLDNLFMEKICDSVFIELFHPSINKNHGGHDGHLRFWGKYYDENLNLLSTVHSMPHSFDRIFAKNEQNLRSYFYNYSEKNNTIRSSPSETISIKNYNLEKIDQYKSVYGYNIVLDDKNNPKSVWHHAPDPYQYISKKNLGTFINSQNMWIPDIDNLDPVIVIDDREIDFSDENEFNFYIIKEKRIIFTKKIFYKGFFKRSIKSIFQTEQIKGPYIIGVDFFANKNSYIQIHFDTKNSIGDQVHSNENFGKFVNSKFHPKKMKKKSARKFFHYHKSDYKSKNYIVFNNCIIKDVYHPSYKIRVLTDTDEEFVKNFKTPIDEPIIHLDIDEHFPEMKNAIEKVAIIQLESYDYNFPGLFIHCNIDKSIIAVDHLTGG